MASIYDLKPPPPLASNSPHKSTHFIAMTGMLNEMYPSVFLRRSPASFACP